MCRGPPFWRQADAVGGHPTPEDNAMYHRPKAVHFVGCRKQRNAMKKGLRVLLIVQAMLAIVATADAQQTTKSPKVGFFSPGSAASPSPFITAFENGLRDLGWIKDKDVIVEYRYAEGKTERYPDLVSDLLVKFRGWNFYIEQVRNAG